jgi:hypothetical protein
MSLTKLTPPQLKHDNWAAWLTKFKNHVGKKLFSYLGKAKPERDETLWQSLLDADVLDHQIVDVNGLRVVRSSDLYLAPLDREIRVVGVDISFKAFIRRIFPGALGRGPIPEHVIDWANVASLAYGTGVVRSTESRAALGQLRPADLADLIEDLAGR